MNLMLAKYELNKFIESDLNRLKNYSSIADILLGLCEDPEDKYKEILEDLDYNFYKEDKSYLDKLIGEYLYESTNLRLKIARNCYLNDKIFNYLDDKEKFSNLVYNLDFNIYKGYLNGFSLLTNYPDDILLEEYLESLNKFIELVKVLPELAFSHLCGTPFYEKAPFYKELSESYKKTLRFFLSKVKEEKLVNRIKLLLKEVRKITSLEKRKPKELLKEFLQKRDNLSDFEKSQILQDLEYLKKYPNTYFFFKRDFCFRNNPICNRSKHYKIFSQILLKRLIETKKFKEKEFDIELNFDKAISDYSNSQYILFKNYSVINNLN